MSSANDHLPQPTKPKTSPLEFRNTDLVSRLLAATPPYLYNMSLLPNTYFFSEMLRSLVHAKTERNTTQMQPPVRRSRKRSWASSRTDNSKMPPKSDETPADWMIKSNKKLEENPLELTMSKIADYHAKPELSGTELFPHLATNLPQEGNSQSLVLPPPPPMWYPPLYPTPPYGIDPLHFFIDLRVSGHIYDRKNLKESAETFPSSTNTKDKLPHTEVSDIKHEEPATLGIFKHPRHCSAFSVPSANANCASTPQDKGSRTTKFDVKSMGLDRSTNRTGTSYITSNLTSIYKNIGAMKEDSLRKDDQGVDDETDEEKEKRVKDLRALLGLELVVDYMKHKPVKSSQDESFTSTDVESLDSPTLEVVALQDDV